MTSTTPPAHVAEMHDSEIAEAKRVCLAKLHAGELPLVVNSVERDDAGNMIDRGYHLTPAQAVRRCVQAQINGDEDQPR